VIVHFDPPINSEYDDFAMTIPTGRDYGYLTSNRPGTGSDDIYKFTFKRVPERPILKPVVIPVKIFRELYVYNITSRHPIPGASIISCNEKNYLTDRAGRVDSLTCNESDCKVTANALGYSEKTENLLACKNNSGITRDTIWMKIVENEKILMKNIYYDFDKWNILPESGKELDKLVSLMKENPEMKVELGSHTDERGSENYNLKLSKLRANSAVDYVTSKGIDLSRIKGTGYGKTQLINKSTGGRQCTPEQDRENRRTEIFIPGFLRSEPVKQDKGDYSNGDPDHPKDYSSFIKHGSIFEEASKVDVSEINTFQYFLVLSTFKYRINATEFVTELKSEGYKAIILNDYEPFKVGIGYKVFSQAKKTLELLKPKYKDIWIWYR